MRSIGMFSSPKFSGCFSSTLFATSSTTLRYVGVISGIRMTMRTMRNKFFITNNIFSNCNCFQMCRINAKSISAKMVKAKSLRYFTVKQFVRKSMGTYCFLNTIGTNLKFAISNICCPTSPQPACVSFINKFQKSFFWRNSYQNKLLIDILCDYIIPPTKNKVKVDLI